MNRELLAGGGVSVIIPVRDGGDRLDRCLSAVHRQEAPDFSFEVIVVDNGSLEETRARVQRHPGTVLLHEPRASSYAARNLGIRRARGSVIAFTDADTEPRPGWLHRGFEAVAGEDGPRLAAGHVEVTLPDRPNLFQLYDRLHNLDQERYVTQGGYGATANLFVHRGVVDRVGLFREDWVSGADAEFCRRAATYGERIVYVPGAMVRHPPRSTLAEFRAKKVRVGRGLARMAAEESGSGSARALAAVFGLLWPGIHAFRPRFQGGLRLSIRQMAGLQMLHWLGKYYLLRGRLAEMRT